MANLVPGVLSSRETLRRLLVELSYRKGEKDEFTLASGKKSDFFIDCKQAILTPEGHYAVGDVVLGVVRKNFPSAVAVAGVEIGGCPIASAVSFWSYVAQRGLCDPPGFSMPTIEALYVRKRSKDHGTKRLVEGGKRLAVGAKVVLVEDVLTTGESSRNAIVTLEEVGYDVIGCVALVDRLEDRVGEVGRPISAICTQKRDLAVGGVPVISIFTRETLLLSDEPQDKVA